MIKLKFIIFVLIVAVVSAQEMKLATIIDGFENQKHLSIDIMQTNYWRIENRKEESFVSLDISQSGVYHLSIPQESMEVFWENENMWTVYHNQKRIVKEKRNIENILSIFISQEDINTAVWVETKKVNQDRVITYNFSDEFADWISLEIQLNQKSLPLSMELIDYENNRFVLSFSYRDHYRGFDIAKIKKNEDKYVYVEN